MNEIEIYDRALEKLKIYKTVSGAEKVYQRAVEALLLKKEVSQNISELGISFCYYFDSCSFLHNFNLTT